LKQKRRGHHGVTMKEMKVIISQDSRQLTVLCSLLSEKQHTLKALDEVILSLCPTEDIEQDITEVDEISVGITEMLSECELQ